MKEVEKGDFSSREEGGSAFEWQFVYTIDQQPNKIALEVLRVS